MNFRAIPQLIHPNEDNPAKPLNMIVSLPTSRRDYPRVQGLWASGGPDYQGKDAR